MGPFFVGHALWRSAGAEPDPCARQVVVFDLDGTLVDSGEDIAQATNFALESHGLPPPRAVARSCRTSATARGCCWLVPRASTLRIRGSAACSRRFSTTTPNTRSIHTRPLPGVLEALDALPDFTLAVCTNKPRRTTEIVLRALGLATRFASVIAGGDLPQKKPDPAPLYELAGVSASRPASS